MIIIDDDGVMHKVVPLSVLEDIKAEITQTSAYYMNYPNWELEKLLYAKGLLKAVEIIDKHIT